MYCHEAGLLIPAPALKRQMLITWTVSSGVPSALATVGLLDNRSSGGAQVPRRFMLLRVKPTAAVAGVPDCNGKP